MATQYETFGPCCPQVGTGTNNAMELLGVCENGGTIRIEYMEREIKSDAGGDAPTEIQAMGSVAEIEMDLPVKDLSVLAKCRFRSEGGTVDGTAPAPGLLLGTGGFTFGLYLPSAIGTPWYFLYCRLAQPSVKVGTEYAKDRLRFKAFRYLAGTGASVANVKLYQRSAPP